MNIVVLCGGTSTERDISLISSEGICKALNTKRHKAILLDVFLGDDTLDTEHLFSQEQYDVDAVLADIRKRSEQLEQIKAQRKEFFVHLKCFIQRKRNARPVCSPAWR